MLQDCIRKLVHLIFHQRVKHFVAHYHLQIVESDKTTADCIARANVHIVKIDNNWMWYYINTIAGKTVTEKTMLYES